MRQKERPFDLTGKEESVLIQLAKEGTAVGVRLLAQRTWARGKKQQAQKVKLVRKALAKLEKMELAYFDTVQRWNPYARKYEAVGVPGWLATDQGRSYGLALINERDPAKKKLEKVLEGTPGDGNTPQET